VSIEPRQTGKAVRYDVRMRTPDGRQYKRSFRTRKEAETFQAREVADQSRGGWVDPRRSTISVAEWAAEWLVSNPGKRGSSLARDESVLRLHILPSLGGRALAAVTPSDIQRLVNVWSKRSAPRTVSRQYDVLRALLRAAVEADRLVRSPCRGIKLPSIPTPEHHSWRQKSWLRSLPPWADSTSRWCGSVRSSGFDGASAPACGWDGSTSSIVAWPWWSRRPVLRTGGSSSGPQSPMPAAAPSASRRRWWTSGPAPCGSRAGLC